MNALVDVPNPFLDNVVADAWSELPPDVASIHAEPFEQCLAGLANVERGVRDSLLVMGDAGSGKTHLLARLQRRLNETAGQAADGGLRCIFVAVKLQSNPFVLWQHVRRRLADDLMRRQQGVSQLQRLVAHKLAHERGEAPKAWVKRLRVLSQAEDEIVSEYLEGVTQRLDIGRDVHLVIEHLVRDRMVTDARAVLRGESLPEAALARLGLSSSEDEDREEAAQRMVTSLCRLADDTLPIVFCFDQIEALSATGADDRTALTAFGRLAAELVEADDNVFIISCVQSAYLDVLKDAVRKSDQDRAFKRRTLLEPLTPEQTRALVRSRLDGAAALDEARAARPGNPFYPFEPAFVDGLPAPRPHPHATPRKVLAACAARFEELQTGKARPPVPLGEALGRSFEERKREALVAVSALGVEEVVMHGLPELWRVRGRGPAGTARRAGARDVSLELPVGEGRVVLHVCNEANMKSLAARLRRVLEGHGRGQKAAIVRDPDLPVTPRAKRAREYLAEFERAGGHFLRPLPEALAALQALRSLVSDALAGDLSHEGEAVGEGAVRAWLSRHLDDDLADFVERLEGHGALPPDLSALVRDIDGLLASRWLAPADELARELERPAPALVEAAEGPS
jgi:hypothetical protein